MPMPPAEAIIYLRGEAAVMDQLCASLRTKNADMVPPEYHKVIINELLNYCAEFAAKCAQAKRITANMLETFDPLIPFEVMSLDDLHIPPKEVILDEMTSKLQEPPFEIGFFTTEEHGSLGPGGNGNE